MPSGVSAVTGGANQTARAALFVIDRTEAKPRKSIFHAISGRCVNVIISHMGHASEGDKIRKVPCANFCNRHPVPPSYLLKYFTILYTE